jgi:hypothetical protein
MPYFLGGIKVFALLIMLLLNLDGFENVGAQMTCRTCL